MFDVTFFAPKTFPSEIFTKNYINTVVSIWKKKKGGLRSLQKQNGKKYHPKTTSLHTQREQPFTNGAFASAAALPPRASAVLQLWGDVKTCQLKTPRVWDFVGLTTKF